MNKHLIQNQFKSHSNFNCNKTRNAFLDLVNQNTDSIKKELITNPEKVLNFKNMRVSYVQYINTINHNYRNIFTEQSMKHVNFFFPSDLLNLKAVTLSRHVNNVPASFEVYCFKQPAYKPSALTDKQYGVLAHSHWNTKIEEVPLSSMDPEFYSYCMSYHVPELLERLETRARVKPELFIDSTFVRAQTVPLYLQNNPEILASVQSQFPDADVMNSVDMALMVSDLFN